MEGAAGAIARLKRGAVGWRRVLVQQAPEEMPTERLPQVTPPRARLPLRRSTVLIAGGLATFAALLVFVLVLLVSQSSQQITAAAKVARAYCADLQGQRYSDAYGLLSPSARTATSAQVYTLTANDADAVDGQVTGCTVPPPNFAPHINLHPGSVTLLLTLTRQYPRSGTITLTNSDGAWHVKELSASLQGTDVAPMVAAQQYCQDLAQGNYAAAYAATTPAYQARVGSATTYANSIKSALSQAQAKIQGCQPQASTYSVSVSDNTASVQWSLEIKVGSLDTPTTQVVTLRKLGLAWKIDSIG